MFALITIVHLQHTHMHRQRNGGGGVVPWLVNVAVSEMTLMRMRVCGQLANIINPIHTKYSRYERTLHRR